MIESQGRGVSNESPSSNMSQPQRNNGFTLIELIVVITLISIMLGFAIPRFANLLLNDNARKATQWIILTVPSLKTQALREQKQYILNIDMNESQLWITHEAMTDEEVHTAATSGYKLPQDIHIADVEYPDLHRLTTGQVQIHFYKKGYSDDVIIHMIDGDDEQRSLWIEPFLQQVKLFDTYVSFET